MKMKQNKCIFIPSPRYNDSTMSDFTMVTILEKGFAQAQVPKARVLLTVCKSA